MQGGGHTFAVTLDVAHLQNVATQDVLFSIYDQGTGWYANSETSIPASQFSWSTTGLNVTAGSTTITGSAQQINVTTSTSAGALSFQLTPQWMGLSLSNGDQVAIWDIVNATGQNSFATVLEPDGTTVVASVTPLALGASNYWTSPSTLYSYPGTWHITIPSLNASLVVNKIGTGQEFGQPPAHVEASGTVTGTFGGSAVTGTSFLENNGNWLLG